MVESFHNPDQYMTGLRQIIAQGRKRIGLLVGAGAPVSIKDPTTNAPLIPAVTALTNLVLESLKKDYKLPLESICSDSNDYNIEKILSKVRGLSSVIGEARVHDLDGPGHALLGTAICDEIGRIVKKELPEGETPYSQLISWIGGTDRTFPVEIFTTNYDLLFEQAMERAKLPYFDGFAGAAKPFFDSSTVANNDLPSRWPRLWKLHGSLGWDANSKGEVIRTGQWQSTHLIYPEFLKYDQTQKAPYAALFDRLRSFLMMPDTLLIATGFSFADAHISARIDECLTANPSVAVIGFQFTPLSDSDCAKEIALRRSNMSLYTPDKAIINGISASWRPGDLPSPDWAAIRSTYWGLNQSSKQNEFLLGSFDRLARFFASSRAPLFDASITASAAEEH